MAYCYECGSEVAENDVFCPYCGISLKLGIGAETDDAADLPSDEGSAPVAEFVPDERNAEIVAADLSASAEDEPTVGEASAKTDISTEKTEEDINLSTESEESVETENAPETIEKNIPPIEPEKSVEESADDKSPNQPDKAGFDSFSSIPSPAIIENLESFTAVSARAEAQSVQPERGEPENFGAVETSESVKDVEISKRENQLTGVEETVVNPLPPTRDEHASNTVEIAPNGADQAIRVETSEPINETEADDLNEAGRPLAGSALPISAIENESPQTADTPQFVANGEIQQDSPDASEEYSETIPDIVPPPPPESAAFTADSEHLQSAESVTNEPGMSDSFAGENQNVSPVIVAIAKPEDDLTSFEPQSAPSVFDSVRIMEDEDSQGKRPVIEENPAPIDVSGEQTPPPPEKAASDANSAAPENFSHTTPIIGGGDTDGKKAAKLKPLDEGTILNGRYEIVRKIGGGGMGAVYLASDNNLGGVLRAVKEMVQSYIEEEQQEKSINDFRRESMILSTLDHVSIPTIYDYFFDEKESRFYLVMKYINGGDLSGRLRAAPEGKIDEKTVTEWSVQVADVLDYLHNRPTTIVYRDLKPANVMIDGNSGRIMLIDFGIARSISKEEKGVTAVGTMGYAPPELFSGNVEPRSDIYSLGSTMFHLLTGADPQNNPLLIFDFQKNPRPRQINPQLSDQIERILMKAVEYNSTARFGSAAELKQCLEQHLDNLKTGKVTYGVKEVPQAVSLENQMVFCGFCGQKIVASDMFCAFCGSKQPLSQQGVHAEIYSHHAPQTAKLMIIGTSDLESPVFNLEKEESFVGRRDPQSGIFPEVDLSKYDPQTKISRRHARIWRDGGNFMVEDLGSSNGTTVLPVVSDGVRLLPHQPHVLASGDKIRIGDTTLHFVRG